MAEEEEAELGAAAPSGETPSCGKLFLKALGFYWRSVVVIVWPLVCLLLFVFVDNTVVSRCGYVVLLMALYWITEALPLPITSMIPIVAFPLMGILPTEKVCMQYFKETNMMYVGGLIIANSVEFCGLHNRIALKVMLILGTTHIRLTMGLMFVTMFLSMWVSNTAATAMMAPIVVAILGELEAQKLIHIYREKREDSAEDEFPYPSRTTLCYFLAIAYASTVGGTGTIVGTGTNLTFKGIFESRFDKAPPIDFGQWMAFNFPGMIMNNTAIWLYLNWMYLGFFRKSGMDDDVKTQKEQGKEATAETVRVVREVVQVKYDDLGPISWHEGCTATLFLLIVFLWVFRSPGFIKGWAKAITDEKVKDSTAAMFVVILYFMLPSKLDFLHSFSSDETKRPKKSGPALLNWKFCQQKIPWGLVFLLGGGFALAEGSKASGLSKTLGEAMESLKNVPSLLLVTLCCFVSTNMTEFSANVAIANILLPVLAEIAVTVKMNPLYLMIPTTLCCSFAFMMPVGTPPNAIVAGMVNIRTKDMMIAGIFPSIFTLFVVVIMFRTWGSVIYDAGVFPDWAKSNST